MTDLDRWAREYGYSDFVTFLRTGGSWQDATKDIRRRIQGLTKALQAAEANLDRIEPTTDEKISHTIGLDDMKAIIADAEDEPADTENAHVQGDDHVG